MRRVGTKKKQRTLVTYLLGAGDGERPRLAISMSGLHEYKTNFTNCKRFYHFWAMKSEEINAMAQYCKGMQLLLNANSEIRMTDNRLWEFGYVKM